MKCENEDSVSIQVHDCCKMNKHNVRLEMHIFERFVTSQQAATFTSATISRTLRPLAYFSMIGYYF